MRTVVPVRTYSGWQHEKVHFLLGLSGRRAALIGIAVFLGLQPVASGHFGGALLAWPLALLLAACAYVRVAGRTLDEWTITMVSYTLLKLRHKNVFLSGAFTPRACPVDHVTGSRSQILMDATSMVPW